MCSTTEFSPLLSEKYRQAPSLGPRPPELFSQIRHENIKAILGDEYLADLLATSVISISSYRRELLSLTAVVSGIEKCCRLRRIDFAN